MFHVLVFGIGYCYWTKTCLLKAQNQITRNLSTSCFNCLFSSFIIKSSSLVFEDAISPILSSDSWKSSWSSILTFALAFNCSSFSDVILSLASNFAAASLRLSQSWKLNTQVERTLMDSLEALKNCISDILENEGSFKRCNASPVPIN